MSLKSQRVRGVRLQDTAAELDARWRRVGDAADVMPQGEHAIPVETTLDPIPPTLQRGELSGRPLNVHAEPTMSSPQIQTLERRPDKRRPGIQRLLFVANAAVASVDELPPAVRAVIDAAAEVYVVTPTLPGRLAWLADDVDRHRHVADERLDTVLDHMHSINAERRRHGRFVAAS